MGIRAAGITDVGCVRKHNEDSLLSLPVWGLFVVADGLGGHAAGEIASQIVVDTIQRTLAATVDPSAEWPLEYDRGLSFDGNRLKTALLLADKAIADDILDHPERVTMGSTVVAGLLTGTRLTLAHVGDSRAYLLGPRVIRQLTRDHSWVAEQVAAGVLTPSEARVHPFRNVITQALGNGGDLEVEVQELQLEESERLLLCSDGLSGMIPDAQILEIVENAVNVEDAVESLIEIARRNGGEDNITAILVAIDPRQD